MPTALTHPAIPLAIGLGLGRKTIPVPLLLTGMVASVLPDADVLAFRLGVAYGADFGHRGGSHSFLFAGLVALLVTITFATLRKYPVKAFVFLFAALAGHGVLDAFTNGGLGVAFFWPWSAERYFAPWQVIEVSPLSLKRFLSSKGGVVLASELLWVWLPSVVMSLSLFFSYRFSQKPANSQKGRKA